MLDRCARSYTYLSLLPSSVCSFCLSFFSFLRLFRLLFRSFDTVACRLPALSCRAAEPLRAYTTSSSISQPLNSPTAAQPTALPSNRGHVSLTAVTPVRWGNKEQWPTTFPLPYTRLYTLRALGLSLIDFHTSSPTTHCKQISLLASRIFPLLSPLSLTTSSRLPSNRGHVSLTTVTPVRCNQIQPNQQPCYCIHHTAPQPSITQLLLHRRNMRQIPQTQKTPSKQASKQAIYYFIDVYKRQVLFLATSPAPLQLATYTTTTTTTTTTCFAISSTTSSSHVTATPFQHALPQAYMPPHFTHFPHCKPVAKQARKQASQPVSKLLTAKPLSRSADSRHTVCVNPRIQGH